jgi:serine/threonine protein kinase
MNAQPRRWREVLKIFEAAGRGLAAAHEKELVHRDFKPDNVMIGVDGHVRVMDFGLARAVDGDAAPLPGDQQSSPAPVGPSTDAADEDLRSTRRISLTGASWPDHDPPPSTTSLISMRDSGRILGGTPAYMAPEQFQGQKTDARADQFSFCVALYEALYTSGPFQGRTWSELAANVTAGKVREAPRPSNVPLWIRKVLLRGLQVNPDERWPSMQALLSALDDDAIRLAEIDEWLAAREIR